MSHYSEAKNELQALIDEASESTEQFDSMLEQLKAEKHYIEKMKKDVDQLARERQMGFPTLGKAYDEFFKLQDREVIDFLQYKKSPAIKAGDIVKEYGKARREAISDKKVAEYLVRYYEEIAPFLLDLREEVEIPTEQDQKMLKEYTEDEKKDEVTKFLTKQEYRKLSTVEKNQLALDRFWKRPKSKWLIGRLFERYVGYLYEEEGYIVQYVGIERGLEDLGRDLICTKGNTIIVVQCKNWAKFRTIYEKHIFQFFGTVFKYRDENKGKKVKAVFYTTTKLSDLARRFAKELSIELKENQIFDKSYPSIKCNISKADGGKIYHLPFDQQYDKVKIEKNKGEFYCATTEEAEKAGFRRAYRWKGIKE
jgi:hypothetical protein